MISEGSTGAWDEQVGGGAVTWTTAHRPPLSGALMLWSSTEVLVTRVLTLQICVKVCTFLVSYISQLFLFFFNEKKSQLSGVYLRPVFYLRFWGR